MAQGSVIPPLQERRFPSAVWHEMAHISPEMGLFWKRRVARRASIHAGSRTIFDLIAMGLDDRKKKNSIFSPSMKTTPSGTNDTNPQPLTRRRFIQRTAAASAATAFGLFGLGVTHAHAEMVSTFLGLRYCILGPKSGHSEDGHANDGDALVQQMLGFNRAPDAFPAVPVDYNNYTHKKVARNSPAYYILPRRSTDPFPDPMQPPIYRDPNMDIFPSPNGGLDWKHDGPFGFIIVTYKIILIDADPAEPDPIEPPFRY